MRCRGSQSPIEAEVLAGCRRKTATAKILGVFSCAGSTSAAETEGGVRGGRWPAGALLQHTWRHFFFCGTLSAGLRVLSKCLCF